MPRPRMLCQRYAKDEKPAHLGHAEAYDAVVETETLPKPLHTDSHLVDHGYAVSFGRWLFFDAMEPAIAFGRAARMSAHCGSYGVYKAAEEVQHCVLGHGEEIVLHVVRRSLDRTEAEVETLKRFVQGVKENPWSSHWHEPVGFIVDYNHGMPVKTRTPSLPL